MDTGKDNEGEGSSPQVEIIPPNRARPFRTRGKARIVVSFGGRRGQAGHTTWSPLAVVLASVIFAGLVALFAVAVIGTLLIWIPLILAFVVVAMVVGLVSGYSRRPR